MVTLEGENYYTTEEVCALLQIKPATLYAYVSRGTITSYRQGLRRQRLYKKSQIDVLLQVAPSTPRSAIVGLESTPREIPLAETWVSIT